MFEEKPLEKQLNDGFETKDYYKRIVEEKSNKVIYKSSSGSLKGNRTE